MTQNSVFDNKTKTILSDITLTAREKTLLGFEQRFARVNDQLRLLLNLTDLATWSIQHHQQKLQICHLVAEQYPLVIFHGDVGTGKTANAECIANRLAKESRTEESLLFKLSNNVRGSGRVGEMGTLITQAFAEVIQSAGKTRRAFLIIDEGDSLAASRSQEHSHHEDKVAVNTLIQCIDDLRRSGGRVVVFLCTNRLSVLDAALLRRAAIVEEFSRPNDSERGDLFKLDLAGLQYSAVELAALVKATGSREGRPNWTYSDIRTRLYPAALARAFPNKPLTMTDLLNCANELRPSPVMEDK
ncbi:AAA family ATPase [Undibacterium sp. SXout11W]|uniref:AAA family ATPase n=1 Tax=Undibacterium sp. SXout11W TaxID=3413050 RepID=UPI003BF10289